MQKGQGQKGKNWNILIVINGNEDDVKDLQRSQSGEEVCHLIIKLI